MWDRAERNLCESNKLRDVMKRLLLLCVLCFPALAGAASCEVPDKALCDAAERGDAEAQYKLSHAYGYGKGVKRDFVKSHQWRMKSAEQGYIDAQREMGNWYYYNSGKDKYRKAFPWYEKAAKQGDSSSQFNLGEMYQNGWG